MLAVLIGSTGVSYAEDVTHPSMLEKNIATLKRTNSCPNCYLKETELQEANLQGANLQRANLKGADFMETDLQDANLKSAKLDPGGIRIARASGAINVPEASWDVKGTSHR
jgi:uncharacterized protein YjbI with pentapeptide repeats